MGLLLVLFQLANYNKGPVSQNILSPLVILSMEKTMVTMVISELKFISKPKSFRETEPWAISGTTPGWVQNGWKNRRQNWLVLINHMIYLVLLRWTNSLLAIFNFFTARTVPLCMVQHRWRARQFPAQTGRQITNYHFLLAVFEKLLSLGMEM